MWGIDFTRWKKKQMGSEKPIADTGLRLSPEDRQTLFAFVRSLLDCSGQGQDEEEEMAVDDTVFPDANEQLVTLSVSFWIEGSLRGCMVAYQLPLKKALQEATWRAARDPRFKPVLKEEQEKARLEITLLSLEGAIPFFQFREQKTIDPEKAYRVVYQNREGWLLPEVFNAVRFQGMEGFLKTLLTEKGGFRIDTRFLAQAKIEIFHVEDYIESEQKTQLLPLVGPLVKHRERYSSFDTQFVRDCKSLLHQAAEQLLGTQEDDGNIPPIIEPLSGKTRQVDWVRLALSATALEIFGQVTGRETYRVGARKAGEYIWAHGYHHPYLDTSTRTLCRVYYGEYLWSAGRTDEAKSVAWETLKQIHLVRFEPILCLKGASFLLLFDERAFFKTAQALFESVWQDFLKKQTSKKSFELALFPELVAVADKLFAFTQETKYQEKSMYVTDWLIACQHQRGSFPSVTGGTDFAYTRGTGKIFEVLALNPKRNQESILRAFEWLRDMQYTKENTFFIPAANRAKILGGFRHDALNQEVWIDASAHVLLGGARLLSAGKE
jgi:AMMECR1 domain-containing protein